MNLDEIIHESKSIKPPTIGNLENQLRSKGLNIDNILSDDVRGTLRNFLLSNQKDWDIFFLDAYEDIDDTWDAIAIQFTKVFTELITEHLSIGTSILTSNPSINIGLRKIAHLLLKKDSQKEYSILTLKQFHATGNRLTQNQVNWNNMVDLLDCNLHSYGTVLLQNLLSRTQYRAGRQTQSQAQIELFAPAGATLH